MAKQFLDASGLNQYTQALKNGTLVVGRAQDSSRADFATDASTAFYAAHAAATGLLGIIPLANLPQGAIEKLVKVALPRIRDFKGIESKLDGRGNYTLGIQEQIIFPEINIDAIDRIVGMNITFVTTPQTDEEGFALLKEFGLPFKNAKD